MNNKNIYIFVGLILISCSTLYRKTTSDIARINLSQIRLDPVVSQGSDAAKVYKDGTGNSYLAYRLDSVKSGLSLMDAIAAGDVLDSRIVVRDCFGKIIGSTPVQLGRPNEIRLKESFSTRENSIIQLVKLTSPPCNYSTVTALVEFVYLSIAFDELCASKNTLLASGKCRDFVSQISKQSKEEIEKKIQTFKSSVGNSDDAMKTRFYLTTEDGNKQRESSIAILAKEPEDLLDEGEKKIPLSYKIQGTRVQYREWVLISQPTFHVVNTDDIIMLGSDGSLMEEFTEKVTLKNGTVMEKVRTEIKADFIIITSMDGTKKEFPKSEVLKVE